MQDFMTDEETAPLPVVEKPTTRGEPGNLAGNQSQEIRQPGWLAACKQVLPIYIATHLAFLYLTYLATLFKLGNFSGNRLHLQTLLTAWYRWDSGQFTHIALDGYDTFYR